MILVVGGGVVGLSIARALLVRGQEVCLLERHPRVGLETSTHNSGVIHAGLYYPAGSLKAELCIEGRDRLYEFCEARGIPHRRCGKLIIARRGEEAELDRLLASAAANGASLEPVDAAFVKSREPHVAFGSAVWSKDTGWVEAESLVRALESEVESRGGAILRGTPIVGAEPRADGALTVITPRERIEAEVVVNAAGLCADNVSELLGGEPFRIYPCRGEYAMLSSRAATLVNGLIYPVPHPSGHGLGVHITKTLDGAVWLGPTIRYQTSKTDYEDDRLPLDAFLEPTQALLPSVTLADLRLGGTGIRAKLHPPSEHFADFLIRRDRINPAIVHAAGIDSPGLTSCLAIGEFVANVASDC